MHAHRQLAGRAIAGLLLILVVAACSRFGPHLRIGIDNTDGPRAVTVTVESSGPGASSSEDVNVRQRQGVAWSEPLASTWEIKVDGQHVIGSSDPTDLVLPSPGQGQDVMVCITVAADGTVRLGDACWR